MFSELLAFLKKEINQEKFIFEEKDFTELSSADNHTIHAVDGGCSTIIDGGGWTLSKIRVAHISYSKGKRINENIEDYYLLTLQKYR